MIREIYEKIEGIKKFRKEAVVSAGVTLCTASRDSQIVQLAALRLAGEGHMPIRDKLLWAVRE
jgi:hypothetical protein